MLKEMELVFHSFNIDYYLVGAVARDIQLAQHPDLNSVRKTDDVDFAVMLNDENQFYELKKALLGTGNFAAHPTETIKFS